MIDLIHILICIMLLFIILKILKLWIQLKIINYKLINDDFKLVYKSYKDIEIKKK
jgi:hypothetical protein